MSTDQTREVVARAWQAVLETPQPPADHDNFFDQGGTSLLVIALVQQLEDEGVEVDPMVVFSDGTFQVLAGSATVSAPEPSR